MNRLRHHTPIRRAATIARTQIVACSDHQKERQEQWWKIVDLAKSLCGGKCQAGIEGVCTGAAQHGHHIKLRSQGGPDTLENCLMCCRSCHSYIHEHTAWAVEHGFIRQRKGQLS